MPRQFTPDEIMAIVVATRRRRLRDLIDNEYDGHQASFVAKTGINQGELSGLLKTKHFGEKRARALELQAGLKYLYLDQVFPDNNVVVLEAREPDVADQIMQIVRSMNPHGQYITLGRVQELAKQYPAQKANHSS